MYISSLVKINEKKVSKLNNEELAMWLSLARTLGGTKFFNLLKVSKTLDKAFQYFRRLQHKKIYSIDDAYEEIINVSRIEARIIPACDPDYPEFLKSIVSYPPTITVLGDISILKSEIIAIVGGRNSSINGRNFSNKLALDLSESGFVVVSGLARGIDTAANSVIYNNYPTIGVIASGIDIVYPRENLYLYEKIAKNGGLIVSELPFATKPKPQFFPQRNRIISGLSLGVVVIEASKRSGSLITANFALNQGKEVFAVSGFPLDYRCSGSNYLIKNGAKLVESADDIIESIRFNLPQHQKKYFNTEATCDLNLNIEDIPHKKLQQVKSCVLKHINSVPTNVDDLILASGLPTNIALIALLELELENKIERFPGNKISLIFNAS
ncbi:MAG: DNA-processing protein DprA [Wolbachia endosymbiont of Fragariocoptes setiger]|nr:DNA-processing protein DprA [Wolbachia endosymbiont of Fragariocoptes setiger]